MTIRDYFAESGKSRPGGGSTPVQNYIRYIKYFTGADEVVDFCFEAMLQEVDFKKGEAARWSQVAPDYSAMQLVNYQNKKVYISLPGSLQTSFRKAHAQSDSPLVFNNQFPLLVKIGAIILFSTGYSAYDLGNFSELHAAREAQLRKNRLADGKQTRLCTEPWNKLEIGADGEVFPCSQLPSIWSIDQPDALFAGITRLQESLLNGNLTHSCHNCVAKPAADLSQLRSRILTQNTQTDPIDLLKKMVAKQKAIEKIPIPPPHLRFRISGTSDEKIFQHNGIAGSEQMMSYLDRYDNAAERSLLDWGCGCGRYAPHITSKWPQVSYTGCDIDAEAINWCNSNLDKGVFIVTDVYPPTPFTPEQFTSVIASSVMTHLTEPHQQIWLREIYRILKPGGIFIASTLGPTAASPVFRLSGKLKRKGFVDHNRDRALDGIAPKGYYRDVFQTEDYTRRNWSSLFDIREYVTAGMMGYQDLVILQKRNNSR